MHIIIIIIITIIFHRVKIFCSEPRMPVPFENKASSTSITNDEINTFFNDSYDRFLAIPDNVEDMKQNDNKKRNRSANSSDSDSDSDSEAEEVPVKKVTKANTKQKITKEQPVTKKAKATTSNAKNDKSSSNKMKAAAPKKSMKDLMGYINPYGGNEGVQDYEEDDDDVDPYTIQQL